MGRVRMGAVDDHSGGAGILEMASVKELILELKGIQLYVPESPVEAYRFSRKF